MVVRENSFLMHTATFLLNYQISSTQFSLFHLVSMLIQALPSGSPNQWPVRPTGQRLFAGVLALIISLQLLLIVQRSGWQLRADHHVPGNTVETSVFLLNDLPTYIPAAPDVAKKKLTLNSQPKTTVRHQVPSPASISVVPVDSSVKTATPETPSTIALPNTATENGLSAEPKKPLKHDSAAIKQAYQDSKTAIQLLEERSGRPRINDYQSKYERFQDNAAQAKIPDCIQPTYIEHGNILLAPVLAAKALLGKCK